jgi:hypothetical protein
VAEIFCDDVQRRRFWQTRGIWIFAAAILVTLVGGLRRPVRRGEEPAVRPVAPSA